ncbi:divergent PAP2 family protein [Parasphaerochaeta coccoides]|uniref:Acid phosphatase/vanadium-dependent haloperoxidase related protein n=1 Tax=Parasphaerochaeta coccoides (strain ATCC BAA-1237 / DSM 17374 / SPN1) TaxID=760011 RepID=F4GLJ1_PARC1|nr:divergent PAP2 family protein [Parasphaerochaeta coccoides]AEC01961.1 acid phosphatase/vanadium-dependent haloperoxidase related protein [Parasphaerochaeta coccoides DSM 17374]
MELLLTNSPLIASFLALFTAQMLKPIIVAILERRFEPSMLVSTGGMPSSHTAAVIALATATGIIQGIGSNYFAIAVVLAGVVTHDAMGIRREAGKQAQAINEWNKILVKLSTSKDKTPEVLKTMLGHSFPQVLGGVLLGLFYGFLTPTFF